MQLQFQYLTARYEPDIRELAERVKDFIQSSCPAINEEIDIAANLAAYNYGKDYNAPSYFPGKVLSWDFIKKVSCPTLKVCCKGQARYIDMLISGRQRNWRITH